MEEHGNTVSRDERIGTLIAAGVFVASGVFWVIASMQIPSRAKVTVLTPAFLPYAAGVALALIGAILFIRYWRLPARPAIELGRAPLFERRGVVRVIVTFVALLVYILILPEVHYFISTFLLMLVGLALAGERTRPRLAVVAAVISLVLLAIFVLWLGVPLPGSRYA